MFWYLAVISADGMEFELMPKKRSFAMEIIYIVWNEIRVM